MIEKRGTGGANKKKLSQEENEKGIKDGFVPRNDTNNNSHSSTKKPIVTSQSQARTPSPPPRRSPAARFPFSSSLNGNDRNRYESRNTEKLPPRTTVNHEINPNSASVENNQKRILTVQHANNHNDGRRDPNHNGVELPMPAFKGQAQSEIEQGKPSSSNSLRSPPSHSSSSDGQLYTQKLDSFLDKYEKKYGLEPLESEVQIDLPKTWLPLISSLRTGPYRKITAKILKNFSMIPRPTTSSTASLPRKRSSKIPIPVPKTKSDSVKNSDKKEVDTPLVSPPSSSDSKPPKVKSDSVKSPDKEVNTPLIPPASSFFDSKPPKGPSYIVKPRYKKEIVAQAVVTSPSSSSDFTSLKFCYAKDIKSGRNDMPIEEEQQVQVQQGETTSAGKGKAEVVVIAPTSTKNHNNVSLNQPKLHFTTPIPKQLPLEIPKQMPEKRLDSSHQTDNSNKVISPVKLEPPITEFIYKRAGGDEISACLELVDGLSGHTSGIIKKVLEIPASDQVAADRLRKLKNCPSSGEFFGAPFIRRDLLGKMLFNQKMFKRVQFGNI